MRDLRAGWLLLPALLLASAALAEDAEPGGDRVTARVSLVEGTLYGRGPFDDETFEVARNAVLVAGDEIFTDEATFAEIELPDETFVRLASGTTLSLQSVSDAGVALALGGGVVYVSRGPGAAGVRLETFAGAVRVGPGGLVRTGDDADRDELVVSVAEGSAELRDGDAEIAVERGETLRWRDRRAFSEAFDPGRGDAFDLWNEARERSVRGAVLPEHVPAGVVGWRDLEGEGTWIHVDSSWAWQPYGIGPGWRPYGNGYWRWCEPFGWVFVGFEPWGYVTSHHGRWHYRAPYGWCWYPDVAWGSAWVAWAVFGGWVGWAPCDFWGRPVHCHPRHVHYDPRAWSHCDSGYFHRGGGHRPHGDWRPPRRTTPVVQRGPRATDALKGRAPGPRAGIGEGGRYRIGGFDPDSMSRVGPVPVRDPRRELAPRDVADSAGRGRLPGVEPDARAGDLLERSVRDPRGVRPEPWNRRNVPAREIERGVPADTRAPRAIDDRRDEGWTPPSRRPAAPSDMRPMPLPPRGASPSPSPVPTKERTPPVTPRDARPSPSPRLPEPAPGDGAASPRAPEPRTRESLPPPRVPPREAAPSPQSPPQRLAPSPRPSSPSPRPSSPRPSSPREGVAPRSQPPSPSPAMPRPTPRAEPRRPAPAPAPAPAPSRPPRREAGEAGDADWRKADPKRDEG